MLKLYFGSIPNALSTALFLLFVLYFIKTVKKPEGNKKWKKAAIVTVLAGTLMSALSGIKDTYAQTPAVSFKQMNLSLAILSALGAMAVISGVAAAVCKKERINKVIFYILSIIILSKTVVVETLRIVNHFNA